MERPRRGRGPTPSQRSDESLKEAVRDEYAKRAQKPVPRRVPPEKREALQRQGYDMDEIAGLPVSLLCRSCGGRNPLPFIRFEEGDIVLDLGCGAGLDCLLAARRVGDQGRVIGVDMTATILACAEESRRALGAVNVRFCQGDMESLPFRSESVDIVFSNGAICLSPDKESIFREAFRVLKSGGQLVVVDLVFAGETRGLSPTEMPRVGPGVPLMGESHYLETVRQAGFEDIEIVAKSAWGPEGQKDRILATIKATKPKP